MQLPKYMLLYIFNDHLVTYVCLLSIVFPGNFILNINNNQCEAYIYSLTKYLLFKMMNISSIFSKTIVYVNIEVLHEYYELFILCP